MSTLDRLLGAIGLARLKRAKGRRVFQAANHSRLNTGLFSSTTSGQQDTRVDLRTLRNRSRTAFRDSSIAKRYGGLFAENVVGEKGIVLQPRALLPDGELDRKLNAAHAAAWQEWAEEHCTVDGRLDWVDLLQARRRLEPMDGEVLVRIVDGADNPFGFALQLLDADQLDLDYNVERTGDQPMIRQGVEMNRWGRPVAYHIWEGHPSDSSRGRRERVPAEDVLHDYMLWRPGTSRGIPWLHAALANLGMMEGYLEAELVAARTAAAKMGWVTGDDGDADEPVEVPMEAQPGTFGRLPKDWQLLEYDPQHPNAIMPAFVKANVRLFSVAGGVAYHSLSGDLEGVNYSSARIGELAQRDFFRMLQQREIRRFCRRVHRRWLRMAQVTGKFAFTAAQLPQLTNNRWLPRGFPWADPLADIQTAEREIKLGVNSRTAIAAERGNDIEELFEEIDGEQQLAEEYEVPIQGTDRPAVMPGESTDAPPTTTEPKEKTDGTDRRRPRLAVHG